MQKRLLEVGECLQRIVLSSYRSQQLWLSSIVSGLTILRLRWHLQLSSSMMLSMFAMSQGCTQKLSMKNSEKNDLKNLLDISQVKHSLEVYLVFSSLSHCFICKKISKKIPHWGIFYYRETGLRSLQILCFSLVLCVLYFFVERIFSFPTDSIYFYVEKFNTLQAWLSPFLLYLIFSVPRVSAHLMESSFE